MTEAPRRRHAAEPAPLLRDRLLPLPRALVWTLVAVAVLGLTAAALGAADNRWTPPTAAQPPAAVASEAAPSPAAESTPVVRTTQQVLEDYVIVAAQRAGYTQHTTAAGAVQASRTVCAALDADPTSASLTAVLLDVEATYPDLPVVDAWALADVGVRALCPQHAELLP